ncbi:unnamed protein product [Cunninghamella blakesleeana]
MMDKQLIKRGINNDESNIQSLNQLLQYVMFGLYSILLLLMIVMILFLMDKNRKKNYPYTKLTFIIVSSVVSSLLYMLTLLLKDSISDPSNGLYYRIGFLFYMLSQSFTWLFLIEPIRQYIITVTKKQEIEMKIIQPNSLWWTWCSCQYQIYFTSLIGIFIFIGYLYFISIMGLSCFYALTFEYANDLNEWINPNVMVLKFLYHSMWYYAFVWLYGILFCYQNKKKNNNNNRNQHQHHHLTFLLCGFLMICTQIGKTVIISIPIVTFIYNNNHEYISLLFLWHSTSMTWVIVSFCMIFCCHFIILFIAMVWGSTWVSPIIKYNQLSILPDENHKIDNNDHKPLSKRINELLKMHPPLLENKKKRKKTSSNGIVDL